MGRRSPGIYPLDGTGPHPQAMPAASGVDELYMDGDIVPLDRHALELGRRWRELHPGTNWHRDTLRPGWSVRQVYLNLGEANRAGRTGNLLRTRRHLLVDSVRVATIRAHSDRIEHLFE